MPSPSFPSPPQLKNMGQAGAMRREGTGGGTPIVFLMCSSSKRRERGEGNSHCIPIVILLEKIGGRGRRRGEKEGGGRREREY